MEAADRRAAPNRLETGAIVGKAGRHFRAGIIVTIRRTSRYCLNGTPCSMSESAKLAEALTLAEVQSLADAKTFARGKAYLHDGVVSRLEERDDAVCATVHGTRRYRVELAV